MTIVNKIKKHKNKILIVVYCAVLLAGTVQTYVNSYVEATAMPVSRKSIVIDAGHGGWDSGKVVDQTEEKQINLSISGKLTGYLEQAGCIVTESRKDDSALASNKRGDLKQRIALTEGGNADLLVSIHQNYFPKASVKGSQVFYYKDSEQSKALAECIQKRLGALDGSNTRIPKANGDYYLLKKSSVPAVIVECGFLSNPDEKEKLLNDEYRCALAWAIYLGIIDYYGNLK